MASTARFTLAELIAASGGTPVTAEHPLESPARVWTDTRSIAPGDFFVPLSGERFDGHDYLAAAFAQGAIGAFVDKQKWRERQADWSALSNLIAVENSLLAYMAVARLHRNRIDPVVVGLTGSSGKTTTKEMLHAAFSGIRRTQKTEKNFNNEAGVSQTLLALQPDTQLAVVEMGMRGLREISLLSEHALPDIALITNVGPAHIGLLGSLENIARAKLEIAEGLDPDHGILVINGDDGLLCQMAPQVWRGRTETFRLSEAANIRDWQEGVQFDYKGAVIKLAVPGQHQVSNALAVLKTGELLGFAVSDMARGLEGYQSEKGRWGLEPLTGYDNVFVINDAYNANPSSLMASLKTFLADARTDRKRVLVLGGMKELGGFSEGYHREAGRWLAEQQSLDLLITVGEEGHWVAEEARRQDRFAVHALENEEAVAAQLLALHRQGILPLENAVLCIKGSRAYGLDKIPELLTSQPPQPQGTSR